MIFFLRCFLFVLPASGLFAFDVDRSEQPATHPPLTPLDGEPVALNPPPMIWRVDERAASYIVEISPSETFATDVTRVEGVDLPFYNHSRTLAAGEWHWRYFVVTEEGEVSNPSPARSFVIGPEAVAFPVPATADILKNMPDHPRIFTTPRELEGFRDRRHGVAADAWREVRRKADPYLRKSPEVPELIPLSEAKPTGPTPGSTSWKAGQPVRRQVFFKRGADVFYAPDYDYRSLTGAAQAANTLSFAYLISGEKRYAEAAREWALFVAQARLDYHLGDAARRASHDTVVYAYETGLKGIALAFDRIHEHLSGAEKKAILDHIEYHGAATYEYLRDGVEIHLAYQQSHPQQAMHALLTTALAVATDSPAAAEWTDFLVRQYVNRIAWTSEDGGYFEGQTYGHKFRWILEGLVAMRTATGIDAFKMPNIRRSGDFWLYCMSLNYWYEHGGDIYSLIWPYGNPADGYITNLMASMNHNRYVQWWSDTVFTNPVHIPFYYLSQTRLAPKPPVDIPQARLFPQTGQVSAFDRFYDHGGNRMFFRSSPWGAHSHSHADQNNFVIHANGEIMAADAGYYTYYGDEYHRNWSVTTAPHNTILVNGQGQPKDIESKGKITGFFESPGYHFFVGDASAAYEEPLEVYKRSILYLRPDVWIVYDELKASEPSEFGWLLNTFGEPRIDESQASLIVAQREVRMQVDHLLPANLSYVSGNERRYPIQTRQWARVTEAVPEPWHTRITTQPSGNERILALLHTFEEGAGGRIEGKAAIENEHTVGLAMTFKDGEEVTLFRRDFDQDDSIRGRGFGSDALVTSIFQTRDEQVRRWMMSAGSRLTLDGRTLFRSDDAVDAFVDLASPAGGAQVVVQSDADVAIEVALSASPKKVFVAPAHEPAKAIPGEWSWADSSLRVKNIPAGCQVVWIDPAVDPAAPLPSLNLTIRDSSGVYAKDLELAMAENGEWIAFGEMMPREAGLYQLAADSDEVGFLIQDRFDPELSVRGNGKVSATVRDATEIFARFAPGKRPELSLTLQDSFGGTLVNYLRNGGFEEGIPGYPPRGWTLSRTSRDPDPGWPGWSREEAFEGKGSMKFVRPTGDFTANSQPMRLRTGGTYVLRFMAKGNATHAAARISAVGGTAGQVRIEPSEEWKEYRIETEIDPGYTQVHIRFTKGGESDQVVWIDNMEFGPLGGKGE